MKLYHGSNQIIKTPDLNKSRKFLDFGSGFYLSIGLKQAENRAKSSKLFFQSGKPTINIYEFYDSISLNELSVLKFQCADILWLDFVCANRNGKSLEKHDIIIGPTANDKTILTIDQYMQGMYNHIEDSKEFVIKLLQPEKLETQYLFATEKSLKYLSFSEAYEL